MTLAECWPGEIICPGLEPQVAELPFVTEPDSWRAFCGDPPASESRFLHIDKVVSGSRPAFFIEHDLFVMAANRWNLPPSIAFSVIGLALQCELWSRSLVQRTPQDLEVWPTAPFHRPPASSSRMNTGLIYRAGLYGPHIHAWWDPAGPTSGSGVVLH